MPNKPTTLREDGEHLTRFAEVAKGLGLSKLIANKLANFIHYEVIKMKKDTIASHSTELLSKIEGILQEKDCNRLREMLQSLHALQK